MADQTIPNTGNPRVDAALERIRGKFTDLEDAMVVQAHLEKRMTEQLKNHARVVADHEDTTKRHDAWIVQIDERISKLVVAKGEFISRTPAP